MKTRIVEVNTTAYGEENMLLITNLTDKQISKALSPIVLDERNGGDEYDNDELVKCLSDKYPNNIAELYSYDSIDKIYI